MAEEFKNADVVGMDLQPPTSVARGAKIPRNCRFEIRNGNDPMPEYIDKIDVFHARSIEPGIKDYDLFMYEAARCLRPNGVLLLGSGTPVSCSANHQFFRVSTMGGSKCTTSNSSLFH